MYVDDILADGAEEDIRWFFELLDERFECKETEWLTPDTPLDYLGMEVITTDTNLYLSMQTYIENTLHLLEWNDLSTHNAHTPIACPIEGGDPLSGQDRSKFMTAVECLGWLVNTGRPDIAYAHSRVAQHMASPTSSAMTAVKRICKYLKRTSHLCLSVHLHGYDREAYDHIQGLHMAHKRASGHDTATSTIWEFYSDSDFAGNAEIQNKRRSQNGYIAISDGAPVLWGSKVTSVAFAHPDIGEAHADISSGAAETYCAANATFEMLYLSYVVDEMGMDFPKPIPLQLDNTTAEAFANNTASKTKMKHIDARQHWVRILRDKTILICVHVDTKNNIADIFTKILDRTTFERLRDRIMVPYVRNK